MNVFHKGRPGRLWPLGLLFLALLFVGCGAAGGTDSGGQNFVFTGGDSNADSASPGALTFNFVKAQETLTLPAEATQVKFQFYVGNVLIQEEIRDFAPSITIDPVESQTTSVVITALSPEGFPIATATVPVELQSGEETVVDFNGITTTPVTLDELVLNPPGVTLQVGDTQQFTATLKFSNGNLLPASNVTWSATGQASVSTTGLVTGSEDGRAVVTADSNGLISTVTVVVGDGLILERVEILPNVTPVVQTTVGELQFTVQGFDQFDDPFTIASSVDWQITNNNSGSTIQTDGLFRGGPNEGVDTITVTVNSLSDTQTVNVIDIPGDITGVTTTPNPLNLTSLEQVQALTTTGSFENGPDAVINNVDHGLSYASDNQAVATVGAANGAVTARAQGTANVTSLANLQMDTVVVNVDFGADNMAPQFAGLGTSLTVNTPPTTAFPTVTVTDDQVSSNGATLTLSVSGSANDLVYDVDETDSTIDMITGDTSPAVTVTFNDTATPATVQAFLRTVTVQRDVLEGAASLDIALADGHPTHEATGMASLDVPRLMFVESTNSPYAVGSEPQGVVVGNFDGINGLDLAVANAESGTVTVLFNDGNGNFAADNTNGPYSVGLSPGTVVAGDLDGNGSPDLAVSNPEDDSVTVLFNDGNGIFTVDNTNGPYTVGDNPLSMVVGNFDGINGLDLAVANAEDDNLIILLNDSNGIFTADSNGPYTVGNAPLGLAAGEFDANGSLDLAVVNFFSFNITVLLNNGAGGFTADNSNGPVGFLPRPVAAGDFDGVNGPDLAVGSTDADSITILHNDGDGTFTIESNGPYSVGDNPSSVAVGDFDGINGLDLAVANLRDDNVTLLLNDGDGTFTADTNGPYPVGEEPRRIAVGDFDGDGSPDLAITSAVDNNVTVLLNQYGI